MSDAPANLFRERLGSLPQGEMTEVDDDLRATVPAGSLLDELGIYLTHAGPGAARATMQLGARHLNQSGAAQAGAIVSLADAAAGWAAKAALPADDVNFVTLELRTSLLRPGLPGVMLEAVVAPVHLGRTTMVFDVQVRMLPNDGPGKLIATFGCTQLVVPARRPSKESPGAQ